MKKTLSVMLVLITVLSLISCQNDTEPPAPADGADEGSKYADRNNDDDRYFKSISTWGQVVVYGSDCYYGSGSCAIVSVPLPMGGETIERLESKVVCEDALCTHQDTLECPAYMRDPDALFLLDSLESKGDHPVFYYSRCTAGAIAFDEPWKSGQNYEIVRYDTAQGKAESLTSVNYPIAQFMTYGDRVYFVTQTAADRFELYTVPKTGGEVTKRSLECNYLNLIGANKKGVYVNDEKGNVYALGHAFESDALIYTVEEVYPLDSDTIGELGMFVYGEYLYFYADFESLRYPVYPDEPEKRSYTMIKHSIRRVRLDAPNGEGEVVADSVYEESVYGVYNGVLYYGPYDVITGIFYVEKQLSANDISTSKGRVIGVRLDTLESFEVINDCGYNIAVAPYYINDRCIISTIFPYRDGMGISDTTSGGFSSLLDFETGALYNVYNGVRLYDGTLEQ